MTFGQFIRSKRLQSGKELTLREMGEQLGISLTMYSEMEQGRKNPGEFFDYEKLAGLLELTDEEKALMYDLAARKNSNLGGWKELYNWDPQYELARQTLLMEQIIDNKPFKADDYRHIVVCPNDNIEMVAEAEAFKDSLEENSKFIIIDPQDLLSPLKGNDDYKELMEYLGTRYWK